MSLNLFDQIIYINLAHRKDRKVSLLKEAKRVGIKNMSRMEGQFDILNGARGCLFSHICALELAKKEETTLILEDDCCFTKDLSLLNKQVARFFRDFGCKWDVFILGGRYEKIDPMENTEFSRITKSFRAHAYAINGPYVSKLKDCFLTGYKEMQEVDLTKSLDCLWQPLQAEDRWYGNRIKLTYQSDSFSDITGFARVERNYQY